MKILVVDDDQRIVKTTCDILKIKGHEPIGAYSGEEGVAIVRSNAPDCVLMDIKMPGITGVAALKKMHEILPRLPVVLVSAYATDELMEEAKRAGAYAILSKPLNFPLILSFLSVLGNEENIQMADETRIEKLKNLLAA
jgi:CheY-like chemotaxis protein